MKTKTFKFSTKGFEAAKEYYHHRTLYLTLGAAVILYFGCTYGMATVAFVPEPSLLTKVAFKIISVGV